MEAVRDRALLESAQLRPFRAALSRVLPGFAADEPVDSIVDPTVVLGEGVLRLLRSVGGSGTIMLLEDLHWADPDTVALLDHLGGALSTLPVVVAVTVRDDWPHSSVARDLARIPGAIHVRLGPLTYADAAAMVEQGYPDLAETQRQLVIKRAEGVPLVLEELLAATADSGTGAVLATVPKSFAEVVRARLRGLTDEQRRVMTAAALVGAEPDWSLAAAATELDEATVLAAARAAAHTQLLVAEENGLRWRHAVLHSQTPASAATRLRA
jgi:predicted ATPase